MANKKPALGRGLSALLDQNQSYQRSQEGKASATSDFFDEVPVDFIEANPYQPRSNFDADALSELAESIKIHGIIQPITVRKISDTEFQLISGERRLRASKLAGLEKVPAYIRRANDQSMVEMALIENVQRENLDAIEVAISFKRLMDECTLNHEEVAERVSKKRSTITNYLRLLKLPPLIQLGIKNQEISMGHARALLAIDNKELQEAIFKKVKELQLSVRKTEDLVKNASLEEIDQLGQKKSPNRQSYEELKLQENLSDKLNSKVQIKKDLQGKGKIVINFHSEGELAKLLDKFEQLS